MEQRNLSRITKSISARLGSNKILVAIRDGLEMTYPLVMAASIAALIVNFPNANYQKVMQSILGATWKKPLSFMSEYILNLYSVYVVFLVANRYAESLKVPPLRASILALTVYVLLLPIHLMESLTMVEIFQYFSYKTIFLAILVALMSTKILALSMCWVDSINERLEKFVPIKVMQSFTQFLPFMFVVIVFLLIKALLLQTNYHYAHVLVDRMLQRPLLYVGRTIIFPVIYQLFSSLLWFFGINGPSITNTIYSPITTVLSHENIHLFNQGMAVKNIQSWAFSDFLTNYGGGGSTLSLVIVMLLFSKSKKMKKLGKASLVPGFFGINEMVIFGFPIVFNYTMMIPFLLVPLVNVSLAFFVTSIGLIPKMFGLYIPWATPIFFSGWLLTGSVRTVIFQLMQLIIGCLIYYPFFKKEDLKQLKKEKEKKMSRDNIDEIDLSTIKL